MDSRLIFLHYREVSMESHVLEHLGIPGMNPRALGDVVLANPHRISLLVSASLPQGRQGNGMGGQENLLELTSR